MDSRHTANGAEEPEARYAYYRRCQHFRKNGEQCKAPAVKPMCCGDREFRRGDLCWAHAGQLSVDRKRQAQRLKLLTRPGLGYGDPKTIQRTIGAACQALIDNQIDDKVAGRLAWEMQTVLTMFRKKPKFGFLNHPGHGGTRRKRARRARIPGDRRKRAESSAKPRKKGRHLGIPCTESPESERRSEPRIFADERGLRSKGWIQAEKS